MLAQKYRSVQNTTAIPSDFLKGSISRAVQLRKCGFSGRQSCHCNEFSVRLPHCFCMEEEQQDVGLESVAHQRWLQRTHEAISRNDLVLLRQLLQPPWSGARDGWTAAATPSRRLLNSPLVHAVLSSKRTLVQFLVREKHERIPFPHAASCPCTLCDQLSQDQQLANAYAETVLVAISSPLYILCRPIEDDAAQCCINFARRLRHLPYYQNFVSLSVKRRIHENIEHSLCLLLDACQSNEEALVALKSKPSRHLNLVIGHTKIMEKYNLVKPLVHRSSSALVYSLWTRGPNWLRKLENVVMPVSILIHFLAYFFVIPIAIFLPFKPLTVFITRPRSKMIMEHIGIIITVILAAIFIFISDAKLVAYVSSVCVGSNPITGALTIAILLFLFSVSRIAKLTFMFWTLGFRKVFRTYNMYFWLHQIGVVCYIIGLSMTASCMYRTYLYLKSFDLKDTPCLCYILEHFYKTECKTSTSSCKTVDAVTFASVSALLRPFFIAKILVGFGHIFHILPLVNILFFSFRHGIVVVVTSKMIKDVFTFAAFLLILILSVTLAVSSIYAPFRCLNKEFKDAASTSKTLFWALFGMSSPDAYVINAPHGWNRDAEVVSLFGFFLYGFFVVFGNIILVNLLIAMMTSSYSQTEENKERDWIFLAMRIKIMEARLGDTLPPPFTLLYPFYVLTCMLRDVITRGSKSNRRRKEKELDNEKRQAELMRQSLRNRVELTLIHLYPD